MVEDKTPPSLDELDKEINQARQDSKVLENKAKKERSKLAVAMRVGLEVVSGTAVGTIAGYFLDKWLDTMPLFFILFFFVGFCAGMINTYRYVTQDRDHTDTDDGSEA